VERSGTMIVTDFQKSPLLDKIQITNKVKNYESKIPQQCKTNAHIREQIKNSNLDNSTLATLYDVPENTICKWKNACSFDDKSSTPKTIN